MNCLLHIPLFQIHILSFYFIIPCLIIFRLFTIYPNLYLFFSFLFNSVLSSLNFLFIWFSFFLLVFQVTFHSAGFYPFPFHYPSTSQIHFKTPFPYPISLCFLLPSPLSLFIFPLNLISV